ncbi:unnamed protein product [Porites evermanni]|uniref:Uncharacterized protein n=1 Tax=Porites evermanni TaxID=104178 RepID=A0ABN8PHS3_9CNID|nr:unnamed protein product [Porites evermanni]
MTINKEIFTSSGVLASSISDQNLIYLLLNLKVPRAKSSYVSITSYKNFNPTKFLEDLQFAFFHIMVNFFHDINILQLMKTRYDWYKSAIKTNDKLHWNAYTFFRQEVKREVRLAERTYMRSQIINSKVSISISVGSLTALKANQLAKDQNWTLDSNVYPTPNIPALS